MIYVLHSHGALLGAYGSSGAAIRALAVMTGTDLTADDARRIRAGVTLSIDGIMCQRLQIERR